MFRMKLLAATAAFAVWDSRDLRAADGPIAYPSAFASSAGPLAPAPAGCSSCGKLGLGGLFGRTRGQAPVVVQLAPSGCFGYHQTQWHRWEDLCPSPSSGPGPLPPIPVLPPNASVPGMKAPDPLPVDPKATPGMGLRPLPVPATAPKTTVPSPVPQPLTVAGTRGKP